MNLKVNYIKYNAMETLSIELLQHICNYLNYYEIKRLLLCSHYTATNIIDPVFLKSRFNLTDSEPLFCQLKSLVNLKNNNLLSDGIKNGMHKYVSKYPLNYLKSKTSLQFNRTFFGLVKLKIQRYTDNEKIPIEFQFSANHSGCIIINNTTFPIYDMKAIINVIFEFKVNLIQIALIVY